MHTRNVILAAMAGAIAISVVACSSASAPPSAEASTAAKPADPKQNPLAGTVLQDQGAAMQKARAVQDTLDQAAQARSDEIDRQAQ